MMSRASKSLLVLLLTGASTISAQMIERVAPFQPVGISHVKATSLFRGKQVGWRIVCTTVDEFSGDAAIVGDTVRGVGDSVQVRLIKYDFKYTYYKIFAAWGNEKDSLELQVFGKGALQKYLYRIPAYSSRPVPVYLYLPASFSPLSRLLVVMHGLDRNAQTYGLSWTAYAAASNSIVIASEFNSKDWTNDAYAQGNMFTGNDGTGSLNMIERWTFTIVRDIERTIARGFRLDDSAYTIWGHSAGAQFVHRSVLFAYDSLATTAIAANSGWYTAPDSTTAFPWGVRHQFLSVTQRDLIQYPARNLVLMRGTADTLRDSDLNVDPLSDLQGRNRYQRAGYFFQKGKELNSSLRWSLVDVGGVGHDFRKMATAAGDLLLKGLTTVQREADSPAENLPLQSYPNPFNPSTTVRFVVPSTSATTLVIYSMLGEKIQTLVDEVLSPGSYSVRFDGTKLATGVYLCRLSNGSHSSSMKLMLLK